LPCFDDIPVEVVEEVDEEDIPSVPELFGRMCWLPEEPLWKVAPGVVVDPALECIPEPVPLDMDEEPDPIPDETPEAWLLPLMLVLPLAVVPPLMPDPDPDEEVVDCP